MAFEQTTLEAHGGAVVPSKRFDVRRILVAVVSIPLLYALIRYLPAPWFFALTLAAALLGLREFYRLHFHDVQRSIELSVGFLATVVVLASTQWPGRVPADALWFGILFCLMMAGLVCKRDLRTALVDTGILILGVLYIGFLLSYLLRIRALDNGIFLIFFVLLVTWGSDTGAYFAGKSIGRHKLAPLISPNKTVEGLAGALLSAVGAALLAHYWFLDEIPLGHCVVLGVMLGGAGVLGDLAESAMKRSSGVKDSGALLPGHGGILDRIDSLLFSAPVFFYYVVFVLG